MVTNKIQFSFKIVYIRKKSTKKKKKKEKNLQIINAAEDVKKGDPSYVAGNIKGTTTRANRMEVPQETNNGVAV